jgi:pyrimidine deaminase RibD-like protein
MRLAVELARQCPPSDTAFSVGAVIVDATGAELSRGFSREGGDPVVHAEESALGKLTAGSRARWQEPPPYRARNPADLPGGRPPVPHEEPRLAGATIYSTLEPCSERKSRPRTCTELIIAAGLRRVVIAWREPALFVADGRGYELLRGAGLTVTELPEFAADAIAPNRHLVR